MLTNYKRKTREMNIGLKEKESRRSVDDPHFRYASLISNRENLQAPTSGIWTCRSRGVRNSLTSGVMNAKLRAETSTRVLINPNQKYALKIVS